MKKQASARTLGWALFFLAPQLVGLIVFMLGPLVFAFVLAFSNWDGFGTRTFAGFDNFIAVLQDPQMRQSWLNTVWFTALQLPGLMIIGVHRSPSCCRRRARSSRSTGCSSSPPR